MPALPGSGESLYRGSLEGQWNSWRILEAECGYWIVSLLATCCC